MIEVFKPGFQNRGSTWAQHGFKKRQNLRYLRISLWFHFLCFFKVDDMQDARVQKQRVNIEFNFILRIFFQRFHLYLTTLF